MTASIVDLVPAMRAYAAALCQDIDAADALVGQFLDDMISSRTLPSSDTGSIVQILSSLRVRFASQEAELSGPSADVASPENANSNGNVRNPNLPLIDREAKVLLDVLNVSIKEAAAIMKVSPEVLSARRSAGSSSERPSTSAAPGKSAASPS